MGLLAVEFIINDGQVSLVTFRLVLHVYVDRWHFIWVLINLLPQNLSSHLVLMDRLLLLFLGFVYHVSVIAMLLILRKVVVILPDLTFFWFRPRLTCSARIILETCTLLRGLLTWVHIVNFRIFQVKLNAFTRHFFIVKVLGHGSLCSVFSVVWQLNLVFETVIVTVVIQGVLLLWRGSYRTRINRFLCWT